MHDSTSSERRLLDGLDRARRAYGIPSTDGLVIRELAPDGAACRIVFAVCTSEQLPDLIRKEMTRADSAGYLLEWKVYGHDTPHELVDRLTEAGFEAGDPEAVLVLDLDDATSDATSEAAFTALPVEIRQVTDEQGLRDVAQIAADIGRRDVEEERGRLNAGLRDAPEEMSIHVAYVDGRPVASGRIHFPPGTDFAELAGGRTVTTHRNRGLFTALVASRLVEARARGRRYVMVDALPTSEPILTRRGFRRVTTTRPFEYDARR